MAIMTGKRSLMTIYSDPDAPSSHAVRIVLAEKGVGYDDIQCRADDLPEDLLQINPYRTLPTMVDRDLYLYDATIIMEYLDERFPHPPLLPIYPVARAKSRLIQKRIINDWQAPLDKIVTSQDEAQRDQMRQDLLSSLLSCMPVFEEMPYFMSEEFSLLDCTLAPFLWRLSKAGIVLPAKAGPIRKYADRVFERNAFQASLTEFEREYGE